MADPIINPVTGQPFDADVSQLSSGTGGNTSYTFNATGDPDKDAAALTRAEFERFKAKGLPAITELVDKAEDYLDPNYQGQEIKDARTDAKKQAALLQGMQQRTRERYGMSLSPAQQNQLNRQNQMQSTLGQIGAVSFTRDALRDRGLVNLKAASDIVNQQYVGTLDAISNAGMNQAQRDSAYRMAKKQHKAQLISSGIGLVGTAAFFALGGV